MNEADDISPLHDLERQEDELSNSDDYNDLPPDDIVAFNELRSCADLYRLSASGKLKIDPHYQRADVWPNVEKSRFIDSLAKQLPIPSMCISYDYKTDKREVVDGRQRMSAITRFLGPEPWRLSRSDGIDHRLAGKTNLEIKTQDPIIYERIENTTIAITVIRCDFSKKAHQEYLFTIFHRLNKGGAILGNQEIRNCIYSGPFNDALREMAKDEDFNFILGRDPNKIDRFAGEELILRAICFATKFEKYSGALARFLNDYMSERRDDAEADLVETIELFKRSVNIIRRKMLGGQRLERKSKAFTEALFVGVMRNLDFLCGVSDERAQELYAKLVSDQLFSIANLAEGLAAADKVKTRLRKAISIFSGV